MSLAVEQRGYYPLCFPKLHFYRGYFDSLCALGSVFSVRIADIDDDVWISSRQSSGEAIGAALSSTNGRLSWYWIVSIKWVSSEKKKKKKNQI